MNNFTDVNLHELNLNPFEKIGKQWMLITAGDEDSLNTMTASWGGMGVLWHKDVAYIVVRPNRYTNEFLKKHDHFSLSFFDESYREALNFCGTNSGRDYDKIAQTNLTPVFIDGVPCFEQAKEIMICRKLYAQSFEKDCFTADINESLPYHILYVGEIVRTLSK